MREPKRVNVQHPGMENWEQVSHLGKYVYCLYNKRPEGEVFSYIDEQWGDMQNGNEIFYIPLKKCPWPLPDGPEEPGDNLWSDVNQFIREHVDLPDDRLYDVLTAWVFCTWIPERWTVVPYIFFHGPVQSGKTRALEVLQALSRRGIRSSNISEPALFRVAEKWKPTLFLDETEIYTKENRSSIQNLLNSGYRRGDVAIRVKKVADADFELAMFDVFGFKALAGIGQFKSTLETRSIRIHMYKNIKKIRFTVDNRTARSLRSRLLLWRFRQLEGFEGFDDSGEDIPPELEFSDGRFAELFTCLIGVANEGKDNIASYARDFFDVRQDEEETSIEAEMLRIIFKCRELVNSGRIASSAIAAMFNADRQKNEQWKTNSVGRVVRRLGLNKKRTVTGTSGFVWNEKKLRRLAKRYGMTMEEPVTRPEPSSLEEEQVAKDVHHVLTAGKGQVGNVAFDKALSRRGYHMSQIPALLQPLIDRGLITRDMFTTTLGEGWNNV